MLNQVILVGRLVDNVVLNGDNTKICLAVPRSYKNENGEYETDFITVELNGNIASNTAEYCRKGDIIGIKGMVQGDKNTLSIVAEKITFLSSSKEKE